MSRRAGFGSAHDGNARDCKVVQNRQRSQELSWLALAERLAFWEGFGERRHGIRSSEAADNKTSFCSMDHPDRHRRRAGRRLHVSEYLDCYISKWSDAASRPRY